VLDRILLKMYVYSMDDAESPRDLNFKTMQHYKTDLRF